MQHQMKVSAEPFGKIFRKEKVIESRLYDEKRKQITVGDEIIFSENGRPENRVKTRVVGISIYGSFENLFGDNEPSLFGGESKEFLLDEIRQFYSPSDEQKNGVVGFRIEVISDVARKERKSNLFRSRAEELIYEYIYLALVRN